LGVFIYLGFALDVAGTRAPLAYGLTVLIFLPVVLAYAERALAIPSGDGLLRLGRSDDRVWMAYADDWLALGGFAGLIGLLGWGVALHVNLLLGRLFGLNLPGSFLAICAIALIAINRVFGIRGSLRMRMRLIYISVPLLILVVGIGWLSAENLPSVRFSLRVPGDTAGAIALLSGLLWGLGLILDQRDQVRSPSRNLTPALFIALLLGSISGLLASMMVLRYPQTGPADRLPLAAIAAQSSPVVEVLYIFIGLIICLVALDRSVVSGLRLVGAMMAQGHIPEHLQIGQRTINLNRLLIITAISALPVLVLTFETLVGITGMFFLLTTILVFSVDLLKPRSRLPDHRGLKLPFHPLFPSLAVVVSLYFALTFGLEIWIVALIWSAAGVIYYLVYARRGSLEVRKHIHVMGEELPKYAEKEFRVLVDVTHARNVSSLIRAGIKLARSGDGQVLIMQILDQVMSMPVSSENRAAEKALLVLKNRVNQIEHDNVPIETLVRLAPSRIAGLTETIREERSDLVLIGWIGRDEAGETVLDQEINEVIQRAQCDVAVLKGEITSSMNTVTVSTRGGKHAGEALNYARWLVDEEDGRVVALNIVRSLTAESETLAKEQLDQAIADSEKPYLCIPRVAQATNIREGIVSESSDSDLLLLGVSTHGMLDQAVLDGIPVDVARAREKPTLLIKQHEGTGQFWLRRAWEMLYSFFPTLSVSGRSDVDRRIRRSALATVDFYVLIILSSVIAVLGLIQGSGAVIIGAMLVAPLMSPILAMSFALVLGDGRMLAQAGESTLKGVLVAVVVSALTTLVIPQLPISAEIFARTQPNLLDLIVALASGAAAAYALSRKHLAAALPGVAIAAALVPPICVVGYGLASGLYSVAGGALLLFVTNFSAILLSGATVFLLLGFRPVRVEFGQHFQRWILLSVVMLLVIAIPLAVATINLRTDLDHKQEVEQILGEMLEGEFAEVDNVTIQKQGSGFLVRGTVYAYDEITDEEMIELQERLSEAIGAPVSIRARMIDAQIRYVSPDSSSLSGASP
jgi:uncharacterized hydrophobic protein (TIGR00271 family)